jgi:hypothetical protein
MFSKLSQIVLGALLSLTCYSQPQPLIVPKNVRLPTDSVQRVQLINSLNGFLAQASGPKKENAFVGPGLLPATSALLDEIRGMGNGGPGKADFYHCYLTNVCRLDSANYLVQFSYLGTNDSIPVLRASFKLMACQQGDKYYFSSPLLRNTTGWHIKQDGNFIFYYANDPLNEPLLSNYVKKAKEFDKKLRAPGYNTQFYCCNTFQEALELLGVEYALDYNGISANSLTAFENNTFLDVIGGNNSLAFDLHDLWHDRLHAVIPVSTINKPIDEGCAYLYGGSWGLSWEEIFKQFKAYMGDNKDWLTAFTENKNFASSQQYHLYVSYVINALLAQKMEKEKGFPAVMEFLSCGRYEAGNDNYFRALDKITGINRSNFNANVEKLVEGEQ